MFPVTFYIVGLLIMSPPHRPAHSVASSSVLPICVARAEPDTGCKLFALYPGRFYMVATTLLNSVGTILSRHTLASASHLLYAMFSSYIERRLVGGKVNGSACLLVYVGPVWSRHCLTSCRSYMVTTHSCINILLLCRSYMVTTLSHIMSDLYGCDIDRLACCVYFVTGQFVIVSHRFDISFYGYGWP